MLNINTRRDTKNIENPHDKGMSDTLTILKGRGIEIPQNASVCMMSQLVDQKGINRAMPTYMEL